MCVSHVWCLHRWSCVWLNNNFWYYTIKHAHIHANKKKIVIPLPTLSHKLIHTTIFTQHTHSEKERQITKIEEEKHRKRERELGKNYLLETYLNGLDEAECEPEIRDGEEIFIGKSNDVCRFYMVKFINTYIYKQILYLKTIEKLFHVNKNLVTYHHRYYYHVFVFRLMGNVNVDRCFFFTFIKHSFLSWFCYKTNLFWSFLVQIFNLWKLIVFKKI